MDTQTRHALKGDKFAQAAVSSFSWMGVHRSGMIRWTVSVVVVVLVLGGGLAYWNQRTTAADSALGAAMDLYATPLAQPGAPPETNTYATANERSKAANVKFVAVATEYGWLPEGTKAHYFAGITYQELGQTASAETELKLAAGSWDRNVGNLGKLALAGLYHETARDQQAIDLYTALTAKPSETVPATVAQLDLADLYVSQGKPEQARTLWAKVKDADKDGAAGSIASQKLGAKQ